MIKMKNNLHDHLNQRLAECENNLCIMDVLFDAELINAERSKLLYKTLKPIEKISLDKIEGMLLGVPIGDALGNPLEGRAPNMERQELLTTYPPSAHITDDTQLTFWSLEILLKEGWFNPQSLANRFTQEWIIGIGKSIRLFIKNYKDLKKPWYLSGIESAGNGALMRLSPVVIPPLANPRHKTFSDSVVTTYLTHNDRLAISSAVAFTNILWALLERNKTPEPEWWIKQYVDVSREIEGDSTTYRPRFGKFKHRYSGPAWEFIEKVLEMALQEKWTLFELNKVVGSGAYLLETIPTVLYTMMVYGDNPINAISFAVLNTKDSDTVGAIVGYLVGALHGIKAFPKSLLNPILDGDIMPRSFLNVALQVERGLMDKKNVVPNKTSFLNSWREHNDG
ncbi:ADP-ribosylglycohydrolase family protein [Thermococcus sp. 18S1]|uniref:ADP-ribosylglycohydrolase family protein n=1 Tax=Thermococcus sp. 18S1 TaxID=1638210 RepID=UPI001439EF18|nr:ADP-ribosylglycohydrolase family protein [Thermococcus sp. 18S1]